MFETFQKEPAVSMGCNKLVHFSGFPKLTTEMSFGNPERPVSAAALGDLLCCRRAAVRQPNSSFSNCSTMDSGFVGNIRGHQNSGAGIVAEVLRVEKSLVDHRFWVFEESKCRVVLSSDNSHFGWFDRSDEMFDYKTFEHQLSLYVPSWMALVRD